VVGILSLLDAIYDVSMVKLVDALHLSEAVRAALVARDGPLGELLTAVEAVERLEVDPAWQRLERLGISQAQSRLSGKPTPGSAAEPRSGADPSEPAQGPSRLEHCPRMAQRLGRVPPPTSRPRVGLELPPPVTKE